MLTPVIVSALALSGPGAWAVRVEMSAELGGARKCDAGNPPDLGLEHADATSLARSYSNISYAGEGANGCAYFAEADGQQVVIKTSKFADRLTGFRSECDDMQLFHKGACKNGKVALMLAENYLPSCMMAAGSNDKPYLVMHAAGSSTVMDAVTASITVRTQVYLQLIAAVFSIYMAGFSHNDVANVGNVMVDLASEPVRLALIDFGEAFHERRPWNDARGLWFFGAHLFHCPSDAAFMQDILAYNDCAVAAMGADDEFRGAHELMLNAVKNPTTVPNRNIAKLFDAAFVQRNLPPAPDQAPFAANICVAEEPATGCDQLRDQWPDCAARLRNVAATGQDYCSFGDGCQMTCTCSGQ